ncbi:MAG TPA: HAD family hydrolase [Fimbriimonas sp.]|nr:HAD family hydrolase [Fimbriimonas sp.]
MGVDGEVGDANKSPLPSDRSSSGPSSFREADFSSVKAIYFDLDDTLCGYWDASKFGLRRTFELHGPAGYTAEEWVRGWATEFREFAPSLKKTGWYVGYLKEAEPTRTEQMRRTLARFGIVDEGLALKLSETYMRERDAALRLFEDAIEVLEILRAKYPLGLITNGPADLQRMEIATLGIGHYFDHVLIEGELGHGKPKPAVFERAASLMGKAPGEMLMVGNSYGHDVLGAMEAGWKAIWVRRPTDVPPSTVDVDPKPEELPEGKPAPDAVINDLRSLLQLLP